MRVLIVGLSSREEGEARRRLDEFSASFTLHPVSGKTDLEALLAEEGPVLVLASGRAQGLDLPDILRLTAAAGPQAAFLGLTDPGRDDMARALVEGGAVDAFPPDQMWRLSAALPRIVDRAERLREARRLQGMEVLLEAIKDLSLARRIEDIVDIVRHAARRLSLADGATFILRDGNQCHYVDEDSIGPLWRGRKFPMASCVSGWAMLNKRPAVIPDIYVDPRIPMDAYRPTFVKSLVMMPIRAASPIGAIGTYWARRRTASEEEVALIQMLADSTALAVENVQFLGQLERRVQERTSSLEGVNKELEAFSASVSHDLRSPLAVILGYSDLLAMTLDGTRDRERERAMVSDIRTSALRMRNLIEDLLRLSRITKREVAPRPVSLSELAGEILADLRSREPGRKVRIEVEEGLSASADGGLMRIALENLLSNAWKYSSTRAEARIEVGSRTQPDGSVAFYVRDNGVGFDMGKAQRLFEPFQRLHSTREFPGTGIGLATVNRVIQKHGGRIWAESGAGEGSTFFFTVPVEDSVLQGNLTT